MEWCCAGTGEHFHQQWQWLFLADTSVCELPQALEQIWLLAVKYTFHGDVMFTPPQYHSDAVCSNRHSRTQHRSTTAALGCNKSAMSMHSPAIGCVRLSLANS